jgi:hypothetical protein
VSSSLSVQYDKVVFLLEPNDITRRLVRQKVTVADYPDGKVVITHNGLPLSYRIFDKLRQVHQGAIVDNKRLSSVLTHIHVRQQQRPQRRSQHAPRRASQQNSIFGGLPGCRKPVKAPAPVPIEVIATAPEVIASHEGRLERVLAHAQACSIQFEAPPLTQMDIAHEVKQRVNEELSRQAAAQRLAQFRAEKARAARETGPDSAALPTEPGIDFKRAA